LQRCSPCPTPAPVSSPEAGLVREEGDHYVLTGPLHPLAIPSTLHDSLMARLDRLATVKEVAQLGATLGRTFTYEMLEAVSLLGEATLQQGLQQLIGAELVYQRGVPPQATYLTEQAVRYWQRAGQQASDRSANVEAMSHLYHRACMVSEVWAGLRQPAAAPSPSARREISCAPLIP